MITRCTQGVTGVAFRVHAGVSGPSRRKDADCINSAETVTHTAIDVARTGTVCTDDAY